MPELAEYLNTHIDHVCEMDVRLSGEVSLDAPVKIKSESKEISQLELQDPIDVEATIMAKNERACTQQHLQAVFTTLSEREQYFMTHRLLSEEPKTFRELAKRYDISVERARQIEVQIKEKIKQYWLETKLTEN